MQDKELYAQILGIGDPWEVKEVDLRLEEDEVVVFVEQKAGTRLECPECGEESAGYDTRRRRWRHLDTCQYKTILEMEQPRVKCREHGVKVVKVPWAEPNSRFTVMFERLVISWLKETSVAAVSRMMDLSWGSVSGIMERAVGRGLLRRGELKPAHIGVDETSYRRGHDYMTVVTDREKGNVLYVAGGKSAGSLGGFYKGLTEDALEGIKTVSMDMWKGYLKATREYLKDADAKIAIDKFHVARCLTDAVDRTRKKENRELALTGDSRLKGTKYLWLTNPLNMDALRWRMFGPLRQADIKTARAWALKETAMGLWNYTSRKWALKAWKKWFSLAMRSRLEFVKNAAKTLRRHLDGILNAIVFKADNSIAESNNSRIKMLRNKARGFRNRERFKTAILFHYGGLDLMP